MDLKTRVVIIGSGVAGGLVSQLIQQRGCASEIVMLEAGPPIKMRDQRAWLDAVTVGTAPYGDLYDQPQDYESKGIDPWQIIGGRLFGRGGSTIHWGGWCPRFMPEDFRLKSNTGIGIDWPYGYDDLEPYYVKAESYVQVAGKAVPGQRDWRSAPYPLAAAEYPITACPVISALEAMQISYSHMPVARNTVSINGRAQCVTTNTCQYCPIGARFTGDQPLDRLETGRLPFKLITGAAAQRIVMSSKSRVNAVEYLELATGKLITLEAGVVFVCAGALETPKLLLASTSGYWPKGIGNDRDLVGRFLVANPYLYCRGSRSTNLQRWQQELNFPTLCSRHWDNPQEQRQGKFLMNMSYGAPLLNPGGMMYSGATAGSIQDAVIGPVNYEIQGALSPLTDYQNRVTLLNGKTRFGLPRTLIDTPAPMVSPTAINLNLERSKSLLVKMGFTVQAIGAYPQRSDHSASTCRMSNSPELGVVDDTMRVHGTENLFIASNAILPTIGAANLTLTLAAVIMKSMNSGCWYEQVRS